MAVAYQSGLLNDFYRRQGQRRAVTGLPASYQETRGLLDPMLAYDAQKAEEAGRVAERKSEFNQRLKMEKQGQTAAGIGQVAKLPLAYGAAKSAGIIPKSFELLKPSTWGGTPAASTGALGTTGSTGLISSTAQGAIAPTVGGTTAQGMVLGGAAYPGVAGGTATAGAVGPTSAAAAEGAGLLGTLAPFAGPAAGGLLGGALLGKQLDKILPGGGKTGAAVGGAAGGAIAGAAIGSVVPGVGTLIGGLVGGALGALGSLF